MGGLVDVREEILTLVITTILGRPISPSMELLRELGVDPDGPVDMNDLYVRLTEALRG